MSRWIMEFFWKWRIALGKDGFGGKWEGRRVRARWKGTQDGRRKVEQQRRGEERKISDERGAAKERKDERRGRISDEREQ